MNKKIIASVLAGIAGILSLILFLNPRPSMICDDFVGGRLPDGFERGVRCKCAGWNFYLKHAAPADGIDLSICIGLIQEVYTIR